MDKTELFNRIKGKLIISCQALPGEPLYDPERTLMPYMASQWLGVDPHFARLLRLDTAH